MEGDDVIGTGALAEEVGVTRQMIAKWAAMGLEDAAKVGRGKWDRERALSWLADVREDAFPDGVTPEAAATLTETRTRLYAAQTEYQELRNGIAKNVLMYREAATRAMNEYAAQQVADVDAWARDTSDEAAHILTAKGISAAEVIKIKSEVANGLRGRQPELVGRVIDVLRAVEDVGATRIRLSGSVG